MFKKVGLLLSTWMVMVGLVGCGTKETATLESTTTPKTEQKAEPIEAVSIYVTRHGKTIFNTMHRVQGWSDTPLTEPGIEVAADLAQGLSQAGITFDAVYSSDAGRARETAQIVIAEMQLKDLELQERVDLREMHFGKYEGDFDENMWGPAAKSLGYENQGELMPDLADLGLEKVTDAMAANDETGEFETFVELRDRIQGEIKKIAEESLKNNQANVLVVSHGMAISSLLSNMTDEDVDRQLPNASVSKIVYKDGKYTVETVGDESFIEIGQGIN